MNSKERFVATCEFRQLDRPPIDYQAHYRTDQKLREYLECMSEEELLDCLRSDFYYLPCRDISQREGFMKYYKGPTLDVTETKRTCAFGIRWTRGVYEAKFSVDEAICGPLENVQSEVEILNHRWPTPADFDFSLLHEECDTHADRVLIGGLWTGIMGDAYRLYGFQNFLTNMALKSHIISTLIKTLTDVYLALNDAVFSELKGKLDIWFFGNDFGGQSGLLISPKMFQEFFLENIKKLTALAHSYELKVMMHSCGSISKIIPDLIEAGVDILDPIQVTAKDMNPELLADQFGGKIVFHGGIDTQQVLPNATPEEVTKHAAYVKQTLGSKGGYIFSPSQLLGPDISIENILAMYGVNLDFP